MRQHWQIVTQKFCLTEERSFPFEPKLCASMGPAPPSLHLLQDPAGCPASVLFPKCQLCCYRPWALCSLFGAATTPGLAKALEPRGLTELVQWLSPAQCSETPEVAESGSGGGPGFAQTPPANARPPGTPWLGWQAQIVGGDQQGFGVVLQQDVTALKKQEPSCLLKTNSNFPWEVRILQEACQLAVLIIQLLA